MKKLLLPFLMLLLFSMATLAQSTADIPLVYSVENTGISCPLPPFFAPSALPSVVRLPNPFEYSDGHAVISTAEEWTCRRAEIKAEIEHYEIGVKPARPANISATFADGILTVTVIENGYTLVLTSNVIMPEGTGSFPVIIGMNSATGSLSSSLFTGFIQIPFNHNQVAIYSMDGNKTLTAPFYQMYPELASAGDYCAWAWGVSRLIDGLEILQAQMNVDLAHIGVTGCSYAGKMALFAGAFDERIALTIAQESGGGGTASWRVSETLGSVENLASTNYSWFMPSLRNNFVGKVDKLPYDHHELLAMVAPRALLVLGNDGWTWLADESGYVACVAAREVYKFLGVEDRCGWDFTGGHNHCAAATSQIAAAESFINRFLRNNQEVNTNITTSPYQNVNYQFWISDWANVTEPTVDIEQNWIEAESETCVNLGTNLLVQTDATASNGKYVTSTQAYSTAPNAQGLINIPITIINHRTFDIYLRINTADAGSLWLRTDEGDFVTCDVASTEGQWQWVKIASPALLSGTHSINLGFKTNNIKIDRINITNNASAVPAGTGGVENSCEATPKYFTFDFESGNIDGWTKQNPGAGINITQEDKHGGEYALKMVNGTGTNAWSLQVFTPAVPIVSGHIYNVTFWVKAVDGGGKGRISTTGSGQLGGTYWADFTVGSDWQKITYNNLTAGGTTVQLAFDMGYVANKTYYIDDIVFNDTNIAEDPAAVKQAELRGVTVFSPSKGKIRISAPDNSQIQICDILGRTIANLKLSNQPFEFALKSDIYIVHIESAKQSYTQKIIIK
ncbi:MAG: carbohydrate binding domain-containing protein [Paludibacter sp.]|jgi:hypothetical protein|nr:carbohydrate binding domain-containing protein [Paludibacter sp.]